MSFSIQNTRRPSRKFELLEAAPAVDVDRPARRLSVVRERGL